MSQIDNNVFKKFDVWDGESYTLSVTTNDCYGITDVKGKNDETDLTISDTSTLANSPLNRNCYTSITASVPASGEISSNLEYDVISRPLAYQVIYHQTGGTTATYDGGNTKIYTDFDRRSTTDVERQNITLNTTVYAYSANCLDTLPSGWTEPTGQNFDGWALTEDASEYDIVKGNKIADVFTCQNVDPGTYVLNLYAHYAAATDYSVKIYFDSAEIDSGNIDLIIN